MQAAGTSARLLHLPTNRLAVLRALAGSRRGAAAMATPATSAAQDAAAAAAPAPGTRPKVLVLTGPTAVGKTKASLALAEALGGEIISADSVQVYRHLDIGSDKVRVLPLSGCCYYLVGLLPETRLLVPRLPGWVHRTGFKALTECSTHLCPQAVYIHQLGAAGAAGSGGLPELSRPLACHPRLSQHLCRSGPRSSILPLCMQPFPSADHSAETQAHIRSSLSPLCRSGPRSSGASPTTSSMC